MSLFQQKKQKLKLWNNLPWFILPFFLLTTLLFLIFLCLGLSSSVLSPCHLLSRRSSLSHIQVCTITCLQIESSWRKKGEIFSTFCILCPRVEQFSDLEVIHSSNILGTISHFFPVRFFLSALCTFLYMEPKAAKSCSHPKKPQKASVSFSKCQTSSKWSSNHLLEPMAPIRVFIAFAAQFLCSITH